MVSLTNHESLCSTHCHCSDLLPWGLWNCFWTQLLSGPPRAGLGAAHCPVLLPAGPCWHSVFCQPDPWQLRTRAGLAVLLILACSGLTNGCSRAAPSLWLQLGWPAWGPGASLGGNQVLQALRVQGHCCSSWDLQMESPQMHGHCSSWNLQRESLRVQGHCSS